MSDSPQGMSLNEALGRAPPPLSTGNSSLPDTKGMSLAEALGTKSVKSVESKPGFFVRGAKKGFEDARGFWNDLSSDIATQQQTGKELMAAGKSDMRGEGLQGPKGLGEFLIGAVQYSTSGMSAVWDEGKKYLLQRPVDALVGAGQKALPEKSDNPWAISKSDLQRGGDYLVDFTDTLLQVSLGRGAVPKEIPKNALASMTKEAREEFLARPARDSAKVESAFDELVASDPDAAKHVVDQVGKFSPEMQKVFDKRWSKYVKASDKELNFIGEQAAKANIEDLEGRLPDISKLNKTRPDPDLKMAGRAKPLEKGVSPDQRTVEDVMRHSRMLQRSEEIAKQTSKALEKGEQDVKPSLASHLMGTNRLFLNNEEFLNDLAYKKESAGAHEILDQFISKSGEPQVKSLLETLRKYVPNVKVSFADELAVDVDGKRQQAAGIYRMGQNKIEVNRTLHSQGLNTAQIMLHEMVHAASSRLLDVAENLPHRKELEGLLETTRARAKGMYLEKGLEYGLTNIHEFLAESFSNPRFQRFLMSSEVAAKPGETLRNVFSKIVDTIAKMLKLKSEDLPLFHNIMHTGQEIMRLQSEHTEALGKVFGDKAALPREFDFVTREPVRDVAEGKVREYFGAFLRAFNPEGLSKDAKLGGAYIAKAIAGLAHDDSVWTHKSFDRKLYWARNKAKARDFISRFERGTTQANPQLERIAKAYQGWSKRILDQDRKAGVKEYESVDHYIPRVFDNPEEVQRYLENKFGPSWRAPSFTKDREFKYLDEALKAGFKPKFDNIEDMFLARQHASDIAEMKLEIMQDLTNNGLAVEKSGGKPPSPLWHSRPAPDGKSYWVHPDVSQILSNAFESKSLWNIRGPGGDVFRAAMGLKNALIPLKLAGSLFHPLHIATIHNATELTRATASVLSGSDNPVKWLGRMIKGAVPLYHSVSDAPGGYRLLKAFKGQLQGMTKNDVESLKLMQEGGFIPEMSSQFRTRSIEKFRLAVAEGNLSAAWHAPWALLQGLQKPIFENWIPSLKISSYLKDAAEWQKRNPIASGSERIQALRKLSKSIDNRYGEMAYNTLFWKRYLKDIAVADTLSLGWNLGFIREYGGGLLDAGQAMRGGSLVKAAKSGLLDRPLFVALYTSQALAYGGLMTWAMTGASPQGLIDYVYPKTGQKNPDGSDSRVQTMFYTREFGGLYKHAQAEGWAEGVSETVWNKGSGLMSLASEGIKGVNEWGDQIRDPNAPAYKQIEQTLAQALKELEPMSLSAVKGPLGMNQETALSTAGFTPAGKYITESPTRARIDATYNKTYAPRETPFDKAEYSSETRDLRKYWDTDQMDKFDSTLDSIQDKYQLTGVERRKLLRGIQKGEDPSMKKFGEFSEGDQKALLDRMSGDEREEYLRHAKKKLRRSYEEPVE